MNLNRRRLLLKGGAAGLSLGLITSRWSGLVSADPAPAEKAAEKFELTHTDDEWRKLLTANQYHVLRKSGTEYPYSSALNDEHRPGTFACAACALALYSSDTKYDSGTGWPSFWQPLDHAVGERADDLLGLRTEVHCRRCGGHLGHVFDDGPQPTGLRYCMNGVAMTFSPASA